jgi:predicted secreted protein
VIENATGRPLAVSDERSGARVVLAPAQELLVSLALSTVNGPEWSLVDLPAGVLAVRATTFERALRNTTDDEGAGASIWRFSAASSGHVTLRFELRRPRSVEPAIRSVSFDVTVR